MKKFVIQAETAVFIVVSFNYLFVDAWNTVANVVIAIVDIVAGTRLVLTALAAEGKSTIDCIYHIDRAYEELEKEMSSLNTSVKS